VTSGGRLEPRDRQGRESPAEAIQRGAVAGVPMGQTGRLGGAGSGRRLSAIGVPNRTWGTIRG
jgi:hypothetical protein